MDIKEIINSAVNELGTKLDSLALSRLERYFELLTEWNKKINLTAITDPEGIAVKHFADSLSILHYMKIPENCSIIDVGTGAGFPGLVLKIARPDIKLTLLDSLNKRLNFLSAVLNDVELDARLIHSRAEDGGQDIDLRESFDFAVSRAVARMNVLSEYCLPYVRISGSFIAFKGPDCNDELSEAKKAIQTLGGKVKRTENFDLPYNGGSRTLVIIEKNQPTPDKYPRNSGKIKASPIL